VLAVTPALLSSDKNGTASTVYLIGNGSATVTECLPTMLDNVIESWNKN